MAEPRPDRTNDPKARETVRPGSILRAMQDKPRATLPSLDAPAAAPTATAPASPASAHGEPKLELVRVDGRVQKIVAVCGCGDRIVIHCDYEPTVQKTPPGGTP